MIYTVKNYIPIAIENAGGATHTFAAKVSAIRANVAGTCSVQLSGDTAATAIALAAGEYFYGDVTAITASSFLTGELIGLVLPVQ